MTRMTPDQFRTELDALGLTQGDFARLLRSLGHPAGNIGDAVRRWARIGPPGEVPVILALLRERQWRPIETAPAGEPVLLDIPPFAPCQGVLRADGTWFVGARSIIGRTAPHAPRAWMPLPPPSTEGSSNGM